MRQDMQPQGSNIAESSLVTRQHSSLVSRQSPVLGPWSFEFPSRYALPASRIDQTTAAATQTSALCRQ
jgi:hypothetical protein